MTIRLRRTVLCADRSGANRLYHRNETVVHFLVVFLIGSLIGYYVAQRRIVVSSSGDNNRPAASSSSSTPSSSFVLNLRDVPSRPTSHVDKQHKNGSLVSYILKQQFLEPFAVPQFSGFSIVSLHPGQRVESHRHPTMHEIMYALSGNGFVRIIENKDRAIDKVEALSEGSFLYTVPGDRHSFWVESEAAEPLKMIMMGVTVD